MKKIKLEIILYFIAVFIAAYKGYYTDLCILFGLISTYLWAYKTRNSQTKQYNDHCNILENLLLFLLILAIGYRAINYGLRLALFGGYQTLILILIMCPTGLKVSLSRICTSNLNCNVSVGSETDALADTLINYYNNVLTGVALLIGIISFTDVPMLTPTQLLWIKLLIDILPFYMIAGLKQNRTENFNSNTNFEAKYSNIDTNLLIVLAPTAVITAGLLGLSAGDRGRALTMVFYTQILIIVFVSVYIGLIDLKYKINKLTFFCLALLIYGLGRVSQKYELFDLRGISIHNWRQLWITFAIMIFVTVIVNFCQEKLRKMKELSK